MQAEESLFLEEFNKQWIYIAYNQGASFLGF